ncbi:MAG: hypothetical protein K6F00_04905 [Lachnospiraceae bacterium]|nr:hypothetical protein [Lachnospiraceae bacterium]
MAKVRVVLNTEGVRDLLRSKEMMDVCQEYANNALGKLGDGYEVTTHTGTNRVNAQVAAVTYAAKKENLSDNTIIKAVFGS